MVNIEHPTLYISSGFKELAHDARVASLRANPSGIDAVLRHAGERYAHGEISTALGGLILLSNEENPGAADVRVYQVAHPGELTPPAQGLVTYDRSIGVEEVMSVVQNGLVVPGTKPDETVIAWALYDAAQAESGNPTSDLMGRVPDIFNTLSKFLGGPKTQTGQIFEGLGRTIEPLAKGVSHFKRTADKPAIESAKPIRLTHYA